MGNDWGSAVGGLIGLGVTVAVADRILRSRALRTHAKRRVACRRRVGLFN